MKTKITHQTKFSKSPVIKVPIKYGHVSNQSYLFLALNHEGNIYRSCGVIFNNENEIPDSVEICSDYEHTISDLTSDLINEKYINCDLHLTKLGKLIKIQEWLISGYEGSYYQLGSEPLYTINHNRYYDVKAAFDLQKKLNDLKKINKDLNNDFSQIVRATNVGLKSAIKINAKKDKIAQKAALKVKAEKKKSNIKLLKSKLKEGFNYIAIVRVYSNKGRTFHGTTQEFRKEKPSTREYFLITKENIEILADKI